MSNHIPQQNHLNRMAKRLRDELKVGLSEAQTLVAKQFGFENYRQLVDNSKTPHMSQNGSFEATSHYYCSNENNDEFAVFVTAKSHHKIDDKIVDELVAAILEETKTEEVEELLEAEVLFWPDYDPGAFGQFIQELFSQEKLKELNALDDPELRDTFTSLRHQVMFKLAAFDIHTMTVNNCNWFEGPRETEWYKIHPNEKPWGSVETEWRKASLSEPPDKNHRTQICMRYDFGGNEEIETYHEIADVEAAILREKPSEIWEEFDDGEQCHENKKKKLDYTMIDSKYFLVERVRERKSNVN